MGISVEKNLAGWEHSPTGSGIVYDLVDAAMNAPDTDERIRAVEALGKSDDPRAVRPLVDLLADTNPEIRHSAIMALGHLKSGRPVDDLIGRLRDRDEQIEIRKEAARSLAAIRSTGAVRGLREFITEQDADPDVRSCVEQQVRDIGPW